MTTLYAHIPMHWTLHSATPAGFVSLPLVRMRELLAATDAFRAWCDVATIAAAEAHIYYVAEDEPVRPFALVMQGDDWTAEAFAGGARNHFIAEGSVKILFEAEVSAGFVDSYANAGFEFANNIGAILSAVFALAASNGYLAVNAVRKADGPARSLPAEGDVEGDYYQVIYEFSWGL